jgi:hypothetical protein
MTFIHEHIHQFPSQHSKLKGFLASCISHLPNWSTSREVRITSLDFKDLIPELIFIKEEWKEQQEYNKGQI